MPKLEYKEAIRLSRNFNNRSVDETKKLYQTIQNAVDIAKRKKRNTDVDNAIGFLIEVYEPYIKKVTGKYYPYVESKFEFEDVLQETYVLFLELINRYDKNISSFSYYINLILPQYVNVWIQKVNTEKYTSVDIKLIESTLCHPNLDDDEKVFNYLNARILEDEYIQFITDRANKSSRSGTVKQVCYQIFLGRTTVSELAEQLDISYHAVYEIQEKIKKELKYFFSNSRFSELVMTSTGLRPYFFTSTGNFNFEYRY